MEELDRRTIDELIARYLYEPGLRDLYVEGPGDKLLFEWFLKQCGCDDVAVFEINTVDVPDDLIGGLGLQSRNRDRVIALGVRFEELLPGACQYLLCVADSDFDFLLGRRHNSRYLVYTDYTSADMYFFTEHAFGKVLALGIRQVPCDTKALFANLVEILQQVFSIRAANVELGWNLQWKDFTDCCTIKGNTVSFDCDDLIARYLSKNSRLRSRGRFLAVYTRLMHVQVADFRQKVRGHDFIELLAWYVPKRVGRGGNKYSDPGVIRSMMFPAVDLSSLKCEGLFSKLLEKYG